MLSPCPPEHVFTQIYGSEIVESQEGVQQGDPRGPQLFCLTIQPLLKSLAFNLSLGYLDDVTHGGPLSIVASDVAIIVSKRSLDLGLNPSKCEVISNLGLALSTLRLIERTIGG